MQVWDAGLCKIGEDRELEEALIYRVMAGQHLGALTTPQSTHYVHQRTAAGPSFIGFMAKTPGT